MSCNCRDKSLLSEVEPAAEEESENLDYENRNHEWTGFEGLIWTNNWYRRQRGPLRRHMARKDDNMILHKGKLYQAIKRTDLEKYEQLTDEGLKGLPEDEFYELTDAVFSDLARMEDAVKKRKDMLKRLRETRLASRLEKEKGKVVQLTDIVLMLTEQAGRTAWTKVIDRLTEMNPEMKDLIEQLKEEYTGAPVPMIKKYPHKKEPKKWKKLEHVPLRGGRTRKAEIDEFSERRLIKRLSDFLDKWIRELSALLEMPSRHVARTAKWFERRKPSHKQLSERKKSFRQMQQSVHASYYAEDEIMEAIEDLEYELNRLDRKMEEGYDTEEDFFLRNEYEQELDDLQSQLRQTQRFWRKH